MAVVEQIARPKGTVVSIFGVQNQQVLRVEQNCYCRTNDQLAPA